MLLPLLICYPFSFPAAFRRKAEQIQICQYNVDAVNNSFKAKGQKIKGAKDARFSVFAPLCYLIE